MSILVKDPTYDDMSWLEQATGVVISPEMDLITNLPEAIPIPDRMIGEIIGINSMYFSRVYDMFIPKEVHEAANELGIYHAHLYDMKISSDFVFDALQCRTISGSVLLVKSPQLQDEKERFNALVKYPRNISMHLNEHGNELVRAKEILELFDLATLNSMKNKRRLKDFRRAILTILSEKIENNQWKIRSLPLLKELCAAIADYINNGNVESFAKLTLFKLRTYTDIYIYSIKEAR